MKEVRRRWAKGKRFTVSCLPLDGRGRRPHAPAPAVATNKKRHGQSLSGDLLPVASLSKGYAMKSNDARVYRYEVTDCGGRFTELVEVGDVLVEDHYRGKKTLWELMDKGSTKRTGWATGKYLGKREQVPA